MRLNILPALSALSILGLGLIGCEAAENIVRIDASTGLVCLILPPKGQIIGNTQQDGHVQCTDGNPELLPSDFFVSKQFVTTSDYVQAWGLMNDASVGMLTSDGGGQYDIHKDSGSNEAQGYPVFVELLEPNTGRWCIRFCHELGKACNMGDSSAGCEGALGITSWPSASVVTSGAGNVSTVAVTGTAKSASATASITSASQAAASATSTLSATTPASTTHPSSSVKASFGSFVPFAIVGSAWYALFL